MRQKHISRITGLLTILGCLGNLLVGQSIPVAAESEPTEAPVLDVAETDTDASISTDFEATAPETSTETILTTTTAPDVVSNTTTEITTSSDFETPDDLFTLGDVNADGITDLTDASLILQIYAASAAGSADIWTELQLLNADCNGDNVVTIEDATLVLQYYAYCAANLFSDTFSVFLAAPPERPTSSTTEITTTTTEITTWTETTTTETTTAPEATTTTSETTTTAYSIPDAVTLPVSCILQNSTPALPTGCEATALTIALNYAGFSVDKTEIATTYLPRMRFGNGLGADYTYVFPGDPTTSYGYGCYAPAIVATANAYFTAQKNASYAENISGTSFTDLYDILASGTPVIFWGTMYMGASSTGETWTTPDGKTVTWIRSEHCLVLIGYDKIAGTVLVADPLRGNVTYSAALVQQRYEEMGCNAVILHPSTDEKGEEASVSSGAVYRLRNAASGDYLTVSNGSDANGTGITVQEDETNSAAQQFRIVYDETTNSYRLYAMCSADGNGRVVDIIKINDSVVSGCQVELYNPTDIQAQTFVLQPQEDGSMLISCRTNRSTCLAASGSRAVIQNFLGESQQLWYLERIDT